MRVTDITQGRRNLFSVFIDGEFAFSAYEEILYLHNLRPGEEISCAALPAAQDEQQKLYAKNRALEILSYGDQSEKTLYTKLVRGGVDQRYAAGAVAYAAQRGLVDDARYAEALAKYLFEQKKYGAQRVRSTLYEKGLDRQTADAAVEACAPDPVAVLTALLAKEPAEALADRRLLKKTVDRLLRRGFRYGDIRAAVRLVTDQTIEE